jgi:hypothetical protein
VSCIKVRRDNGDLHREDVSGLIRVLIVSTASFGIRVVKTSGLPPYIYLINLMRPHRKRVFKVR